ncbi:MAG TPA: MEDS domain-containing protein [Mycobacteriales bacterium]|nr:MEDS domain-containing protein [Mycobacteriales bacterium]
MKALDLGIQGVLVSPGDHLCGLYSGSAERDRLLVAMLRAGLSSGDKCICVVDGAHPTDIAAAVGPDVDGAERSDKQLEIVRAADMYLRSGRFSAPEIISAWKATISDVMYDGRFDLVRGIETWSRRDVVPDPRELLVLESEMRRYLPLYPQVVVCLYDLDRFGGGIVVDLLKTHPRVLVNGMVLENPYCLSPDDLLNGETDSDHAVNERLEMAEWCYAATTGST